MFGELKSSHWIIAKGFLFLLAALAAGALLVAEHPSLRVAFLLLVAVWCFARFYYFAFYVLEHYVDANYRFHGLWHASRFALAHWIRSTRTPADDHD